MFDLSFAEIALIVVVAVIFIGPKELPVVIKAVAKAFHSIRSLSKELQQALEELGRESGLEGVAKDIKHEMRMIQGDDGKMYESFDLPHIHKVTSTPPIILPPDIHAKESSNDA